MRFVIGLLVFVSFFGCIAGAHAHDIELPQKLEDLSLFEVSPNIYVAHGTQALPDKENKGFMSNTGVLLTKAGVVIVDSGGSAEVARMIMSKVHELTRQPIVAIFNTHIHGDHWLGNAAIREVYPKARIIAHERAIERLNEGEAQRWVDIFARMTGKSVSEIPSVVPDEGVKGGEELVIGGLAFKTHHTGHAHTDSDVMIEVPRSRVLFTGDIVEHGRAISSDVPQDFDAKGQISAIEYAMKLPIDTYVPGHGQTGNAKIPKDALRFLQTLYYSVKRYYDAGLQDYEMRDKVAMDLSEFSDWANFDQLGKLVSHVYLQVEQADFR